MPESSRLRSDWEPNPAALDRSAGLESGHDGRPAPGPAAKHRVRERPSNLYGLQHETIMVTMTTVSISDLKANLSRYLREVRRGGEVQVLDRGAPVARLVPVTARDDEGVRERLVAAGLLRPGNGEADAILESPPLRLPVGISDALSEDRADRL